MPKVLNYHKDGFPEGAINIMRGHKYGNPFIIGVDGDRDEVCNKYEVYAENKFSDEEIRKDLQRSDLICCCKDKRCHGDYLLRRANPQIKWKKR